jgi:hypothetical protein
MYDDPSPVPPAPILPAPVPTEVPAATWPPAAPFNVLPPAAPAPRRRGWLPLAGAATAVVALAAVALVVLGGSSGSNADAATIVRAASQRAASVGTSSVSIDMKMTVAGHTIDATGGGAFDYRRRVGYMSIDMNGVGNMQEVITKKAFFMRFPDAMRAALGTSRPWLEMRFSTLKAASGVDLSKLMNANPTGDPSSMLRVLSQAHVVHRDGTENVRGVATTRYSVTATMGELLRAEGLTSAVDLSKQPAGAADQQIHFVVSVDKQGLPRRLVMSMNLAGMGNMDMTMDMFDFGAPVHVSVPPPSIVTDISKELTS